MAPVQNARGGSPAPASGIRNVSIQPRFPLPKRIIQEIAALVAKKGRSLVRIEIAGHVKDSFDDIYDDTDDDDEEDLINDLPPADLPGPSGYIPPPDLDNDLTSLSWLQDRNLLRDMNLGQPSSDDDTDSEGPPPHIVNYRFPPSIRRNSPQGPRAASPDSSTCSSSDLSAGPPRNLTNVANALFVHNVDDEPNVVVRPYVAKPPFPFAYLIFRAMDSNPQNALRVKDIYSWIMQNYPYYRNAPPGWKNSVRHNLSLKKWFHKVSSTHSAGRGCLWSFDSNCREALLQIKCKQQASVREPLELEAHLRRPKSRIARAPKRRVVKRPSPSNAPCPSTSKEQRPSTSTRQSPSTSNGQRRSSSYGQRASTSNDQSSSSSNLPSADEYMAAAGVLAFKYGPNLFGQMPMDLSPPRPDSQSSNISTESDAAEALLTLAGYSHDDSSS